MNTTYRFRFDDQTDLDEAESTLHLAILAAEGLFGEALLRVRFSYRRDDDSRCLQVNGGNEISESVVRIFTSLAIKEFGSTAFSVSNALGSEREEPLAIAT
ncbi:MAG: hypothetical protein AAF085_00080 [Planctomycetota bacterium]